jgi:cytidylate kinase
MPAITVTRLFGSGGGEVARQVAESLGWRLVDNAFVDGIARGLRATPAIVEAIDERSPSLAERLADALALGGGEVVSASLATPMPPTEQRVADVTREVIDQAIARGPAVVVGRGAQAYLAQRTDVIHVNCYAPHEALVERVMTRDGLSHDAADALVREKNQQREQYVKRNFGRALLAPEHYHIMLNTAWLGIDRCVALVLDLAREKLGARPERAR